MRFDILLFATWLSVELCESQVPTYSICSFSSPSINATTGRITSPNYPNEYNPYTYCVWNLVSQRGDGIRITIEHLDHKEIIGPGKGRCYDGLEIVSINAIGQTEVVASKEDLCANDVDELMENVYEIQNAGDGVVEVQITFSSEYHQQGTGFSIYFARLYATIEPLSTTITSTVVETTDAEMKNCSYTNDGILCQRWDVETPHFPKHTPLDTNHNFCRNPDMDSRGSWCYTTDPNNRWGYCDLDNCFLSEIPSIVLPTASQTENSTSASEVMISFSDGTETTEAVVKNCSYTHEGILCQRWDVKSPHIPKHIPTDSNHNFCRNPDMDNKGPWCYTEDPYRRWGYCDLDNCFPSIVPATVLPTWLQLHTTASLTNETENFTKPSEVTVSFADEIATTVPARSKQWTKTPATTTEDAVSGIPWIAFVIVSVAMVAIIIATLT